MKLRPAWMMVAVVLLVCTSLASVWYLEQTPTHRIAAILGIADSSSTSGASKPLPKITPAGGDQSAALGSLVVQTFSGATFIRQGPATAVSADGLILTLSSIAPHGSGSYIYQVVSPEGQVARATRVAYDPKSGLILLHALGGQYDAVLFEDAQLFAGRQLEAVMTRTVLSHVQMMRLPLWVVSISASNTVTLSVDRSFSGMFHGARVVDGSYQSVGVFQHGASPGLISAETINDFIDSYLATPVTP